MILQSCLLAAALTLAPGEDLRGWLSWRGPQQNGTSAETGLPDAITLDGTKPVWTFAMRGRGTPVVAGGRVFSFCYEGEGSDLQEALVCLDEKTGAKIWEHRFNDFLTEVVYDRYSIGSPTVDAETGNVYLLNTAGIFSAFSADGELVWQHSMMSEFGRLSFPNGRLGAPVIDGDLVIHHVITSHWGPNGPARDRFFAFDKRTGANVWVSTPGVTPKDSSFSHPVFTWLEGRRVLIAGTGCGHLVCIDARTGDTLWRYQLSIGGVNSAPVLYGDAVIAIHGKENVDTSVIGRMLSVKLNARGNANDGGIAVFDKSCENWRNDLVAFSSSPVLVGNRVYQTTMHGDLCCIDADTGAVLWHERLAKDQIHASPVAADGKLYVPMNDGSFHVVRPSDEGPEVLSSTQLEGNCLGAPAVANGRIYVHTTEKLYCFGSAEPRPGDHAAPAARDEGEPGDVVRLQVVPADVLLTPGEIVDFRVRGLDASGRVVEELQAVAWETGRLGLSFDTEGFAHVGDDAAPGAGVVRAQVGDMVGTARVRIVPNVPFAEDFESVALDEEGIGHPGAHWLGGRKKWDVRELDGTKVLAKTLDNPLFQRVWSFFGHPDMSNYTVQVDIRTDGNRRTMSTAGVLNQRYMILLKGNHQQIEVSSNEWRIKESVPFRWKPDVWYTLKARVDVAEDGSGVVRAKAWKRDEAEPEGWLIEVPHANAHKSGSPGLYGLAPQSRFRVYVDNISVTPNE